MELILENIEQLKHTEITLHKLSVIAGENDSSKSTVGKIVSVDMCDVGRKVSLMGNKV
jgi:predicted ATPase